MDVLTARAMTKQEIDSHYSFLYSKSDKLKQSSNDVIVKKYQLLIDAYKSKEQQIVKDNEFNLQDYNKRIVAYNSGKCICGSDVQFVESYQFWGCKEYLNKNVNHKNFIIHKQLGFGEPKLYSSNIPTSYINDIIRENGLKGKINAKALLNFYEENGFIDLKVKYDGSSSKKSINQFTVVKSVADKFEAECLSRIKPLYTNVKSQFHIIYQLKGGKPNQVAKLDLLCSNEKEVLIFECKTSKNDQRDDQRDLYISLIKHINTTRRPVKFHYLFDKERDTFGFDIIQMRELWVSNGLHFGYPKCCIDGFLNNIITEEQEIAGYNTGFIPCIECVKKLKNPRDLELLIVNRICETDFPHAGYENCIEEETHRYGVPEYYL